MKLELTTHEAALLKSELAQRLVVLDREIVRTDRRDLRHALGRDIDELRGIERRLERELDELRTEDGFV